MFKSGGGGGYDKNSKGVKKDGAKNSKGGGKGKGKGKKNGRW